MDIYKQYFNKTANDKRTVNVGRLTAAAALNIAVLVAPLLDGLDQAFQYIQEYTGLVSPGILAVFLLGLFYRKTTNKAAIWGAILSIPLALALKILPTSLASFEWLAPWMHQMGLTTLLTMAIIMLLSKMETKGENDAKGITLTKELFKTSPLFNVGSFAIMIVLAVLYAIFW